MKQPKTQGEGPHAVRVSPGPGPKASPELIQAAGKEALELLAAIWDRNLPRAAEVVRAMNPSPAAIAFLAFIAHERLTSAEQRVRRSKRAAPHPELDKAAITASQNEWIQKHGSDRGWLKDFTLTHDISAPTVRKRLGK